MGDGRGPRRRRRRRPRRLRPRRSSTWRRRPSSCAPRRWYGAAPSARASPRRSASPSATAPSPTTPHSSRSTSGARRPTSAPRASSSTSPTPITSISPPTRSPACWGSTAMMPVTVHRNWNGKDGTITWWIDDAFDESTRLKEKRQPPNPLAWNYQMYKMRVFAALVGDSDRNLGNVLITNDWKLWMIDFTPRLPAVERAEIPRRPPSDRAHAAGAVARARPGGNEGGDRALSDALRGRRGDQAPRPAGRALRRAGQGRRARAAVPTSAASEPRVSGFPELGDAPARGSRQWTSEDWSGRRGSNPRPTAWEAVTLPLSYSRSVGPFYHPAPRRLSALR